MGFHSYCLVPRGRRPDAQLTGLDGAPVFLTDAAHLGVWCSEHAAPPAVDAKSVRTHNRVIESAMSPTVTPVPLRFGQWFDTLERIRNAVDENATAWLALLDRFAGCVEYGLSVASAATHSAVQDVHRAAHTGREYMAALARRHAAATQRRVDAEALGGQLQEALASVVVATTVDYPESGGLVSIAALVARSRAGAYHDTLADLRRSRSDLSFLLTGPWPPYSFVA
jgi:hypothetical protein